MRETMKVLFLLSTLACFAPKALADITVVNSIVVPSEIYDFTYSNVSNVWWRGRNRTMYYCIFRNLWTKESAPNDYPKNARWTDPVLYVGTQSFQPWINGQAVSVGIGKIATSGFTDTFDEEMKAAGTTVLDNSEGDGFFLNEKNNIDNYVYMPPIEVSFEYPFVNGIAAMKPSPDWFTGFYLFNVVDQYSLTYWNRWTIQTYPWDAGYDSGQYYTAPMDPTNPYQPIFRFNPSNVPQDGAFLSPDGKSVPPVAEWDCELFVCPLDNPFCEKPDWPPSNYCDILKYPTCNSYCNPNATQAPSSRSASSSSSSSTTGSGTNVPLPCVPCRGNGWEPKTVYFNDCCASGHDPLHGPTCAVLAASVSGGVVVSAFAGSIAVVGVWISLLTFIL